MCANRLAIIIPAYKPTYFSKTLDSIAAQTCKDFTLYIGDDCSPGNLEKIVDRYRDKINLVYKRFDTNLGGTDLVAQWERCIDMMQDEDWIWLFSDDDVMEDHCVEEFYHAITENPQAGLVHFNVTGIYGKDEQEKALPMFPPHLTAKEYLDKHISGDVFSYVVEFIVRKDIYLASGGFEKYDLAWGSDFVSWIKFATNGGGIFTCNNAMIKWRSSGENITTDFSNAIVVRKLKSYIDFTYWIYKYSQKHKFGRPFFYSKSVFAEILNYKPLLSKRQFACLEARALMKFGFNLIPIVLDGFSLHHMRTMRNLWTNKLFNP